MSQNYADEDATSIATNAPTVQRFSKLLAFCFSASISDLCTYTGDVTQVYNQSRTPRRDSGLQSVPDKRCVHPPASRALNGARSRLEGRKTSLFGIPESGLHWCLTYLAHHRDVLQMKHARVYRCVMIRRTGGRLDGLVLLQVDDSLGLGTELLLEKEGEASKMFRYNPRTPFTTTLKGFNRLTITRSTKGALLDNTKVQDKQISRQQRRKSNSQASAR